MTSLSSQLSGQLLADVDLPDYQAHHAAKHGLLRNYANAWLPKPTRCAATTALVSRRRHVLLLVRPSAVDWVYSRLRFSWSTQARGRDGV